MAVPFVKAGLFEEFEVHEDRVIHKDESGVLCRGCRRSEGGAVAIKIMHPGSVIPERLLRIARKEAGIFEHQPDEHVLSVVGTGLWKGRTFYALEDVQGESLLKQLQAGRRFTTDEILHIGEGVGRALKAAWAAGCVHGAIRPAHVFLTPAGNVKLIGFGLPRNLEQNTGSPGGLSALRYLAPEQVRSEPLNVQSDLYSLGIVLYELATGKTPFDGFESSTSLLYQVSYVDPAPPRSAGSLIAPDLERLILRCLEKRREQRMTSPEAFLGDIEAVRNSARTSEPSPLDDDRGDFEIFPDQTIGEGGMGTLYRGRQISLDRPVAIKVIRGILTSSPDYVQRFRREAELLAQVNDPSIVQVFGTGTWKGRVFYAMELVEGKDLAVLLEQKGRLVVDEILDIGEGVAQALKAAWAYKIVHRDIKPSNILVTPDRRVKVADFGLAKSLRVPRRDSQLIAGTSEYISPEQAMGLSVDIRADLYSLGVVMYELASGRPPFTTEESFTGLVYHHVHTPPAHLSTMAPDLPEPLMTLIHGCLSKDPEGRPGSPDEIIDAIQGIRRRRQRARAPRPLLRVLWTRTLRAGRRTWSSRRSLTLRGAAILVILMLVLPAALGVTGLVEEMRRKESESPARKAYDLAITIGDFDSALRVAQETYGRQSKEYREAERLQKETGLLDKERNARDCMASEDWDGASSWYQLLESGSTALEQRRFAQARSYCQTLARARRFEREGSPESALAVYLSLLALGTPYEKYLRERIDALERRKP